MLLQVVAQKIIVPLALTGIMMVSGILINPDDGVYQNVNDLGGHYEIIVPVDHVRSITFYIHKDNKEMPVDGIFITEINKRNNEVQIINEFEVFTEEENEIKDQEQITREFNQFKKELTDKEQKIINDIFNNINKDYKGYVSILKKEEVKNRAKQSWQPEE